MTRTTGQEITSPAATTATARPTRMPVNRAMMGCHLLAATVAASRVTVIQVTQKVACNALHSVEERCSRWMLLTHDRVRSDEFPGVAGTLRSLGMTWKA